MQVVGGGLRGEKRLDLVQAKRQRDRATGLGQQRAVLALEPIGAISERKIARYLSEQGSFGVLTLVQVLIVAGDRLGQCLTVARDNSPSDLLELGEYAAGIELVVVERGGMEDLKVVELNKKDEDQGRRPGTDHSDPEIYVPHGPGAWASAATTRDRSVVSRSDPP